MFNTIFKKHLFSYMAMLVVTFIILAAVLTAFFSSYVMDQKQRYLEEASKKFATIYRQKVVTDSMLQTFGVIADTKERIERQLTLEFQNMQMYMSVHVFLTNADMIVQGCSDDLTGQLWGKEITDTELRDVLNGNIATAVSILDGVFTEREIIVGYPIYYDNAVVAAAFVSAPLSDVNITVREILTIIFSALLASMMVSFVLIYFTSSTISRPIRLISKAALEFASGDLNKRMPVRGTDEVALLAESFNDMAKSLQNQENQRREFIANISHDLRSPLTSMKGFLSAIIDGTVPQERQGHYLEIVLQESDRLSKLANDLMEISKLQNLEAELNLAEFDICEMIRQTVIMFEQRINAKSIEVSVILAKEKTLVNADTEKIQRVLYNLIDNAVKFSEDNGALKIETIFAEGKLLVSVKDNGRGISIEDQKRIFERFYKADISRGEDKLGSGLGLSIVREFIRAHGEVITINSEPGQGCEFVFTLSKV